MAEIVSRIYNGFRGVDFRGEETDLTRSPDSVNMWRDYKQIRSIRTRPGMTELFKFERPVLNDWMWEVDGIYFYKGEMLVVRDAQLYRIADGVATSLFNFGSTATYAVTDAFVWGDKWYMLGCNHYIQYDGETVSEVAPYVPTTTIGKRPAGGGTVHEDVNLLTSRRKNTFTADGESTVYYLDSRISPIDTEVIVKVNGVTLASDQYEYTVSTDYVVFTQAPEAPLTDGQDNVEIEFTSVSDSSDDIKMCSITEVFDNRVFVGGNRYKPNRVWHCSVNDPSYFSDLDYYIEGLDEAKVTGMVAGNNVLWVFREPSPANTTVFYHTPTIDAEYGKIYPSQHSSIATGCIGRAINFNDDIVFFSPRGMEGVSGDIGTEQMIAHRSSLVDKKLLNEENYKDMILAEWEGYLAVFLGKKVYLADSRAVFTNTDHTEYEWYYWELEHEVTCATVHDGVLYVGTQWGGIYAFTDPEGAVESYWTTPKDKFQYPHKLKTTNKRGCVAEATGDIDVYAKLEDTDFEQVGQYNGVTDYFVSRIKRKKFKDIQLKFHSMSRFSLESVTLECFIGGYVKR